MIVSAIWRGTIIGIAHRLVQTVQSSELVELFGQVSAVARLGGDEFVILIENIQSLESALLVAERLQQDTSAPFFLDGHAVFATFSIGIALSSRDYESADDILRDADTAMYVAKASGKASTAVFDKAMRSRAVARLAVETDLRMALSTSQGFGRALPASGRSLEWSPFLRQMVKAQNPLNGELSHGVVTQAVHEGV